jgi:NAD(P)-dependent dehydrogenase (short-subunit alcohol dehydrogenase family)
MAKTILLLGRKGIIVSDAQSQLPDPGLKIYTGTNIEDVKAAFEKEAEGNGRIDYVFMGAGIELEKRLEIVREVYERSRVTSVFLKDAESGPGGFLAFVRGVLRGVEGGVEVDAQLL